VSDLLPRYGTISIPIGKNVKIVPQKVPIGKYNI
jgi:hypothetical protein